MDSENNEKCWADCLTEHVQCASWQDQLSSVWLSSVRGTFCQRAVRARHTLSAGPGLWSAVLPNICTRVALHVSSVPHSISSPTSLQFIKIFLCLRVSGYKEQLQWKYVECVSGFISCSQLASRLEKRCPANLGCSQRQKSSLEMALEATTGKEKSCLPEAIWNRVDLCLRYRLCRDGSALQLQRCRQTEGTLWVLCSFLEKTV